MNLQRRSFIVLMASAMVAACSQGGTQEQVIRVAVSPASPPNLFEENGETKGLDLDLFRAYCQARKCELQITSYDWQGMLGAVASGKADVAFSAISITEPRRKMMDFSKPYMENTWNLVSLTSRNIKLNDLNQLKQYRIGYPRGMAYSEYIRAELEPQGLYSLDQVKLYPSYNEVMTDLQNGQIDLAFLDGPVASVYRKKMPVQDSFVLSGRDRFGFAFPKGSPLREDFDRFLDELGEPARQQIIARWMD